MKSTHEADWFSGCATPGSVRVARKGRRALCPCALHLSTMYPSCPGRSRRYVFIGSLLYKRVGESLQEVRMNGFSMQFGTFGELDPEPTKSRYFSQ